MIGTEKEMLEEKVQILELQCDAANERIKTLEKELDESKLKWHDIRKDPNDMPPKEEESNFTIKVFTNTGEIAFYTYYDNTWVCDFDGMHLSGIVAWTELPKFEEKK